MALTGNAKLLVAPTQLVVIAAGAAVGRWLSPEEKALLSADVADLASGQHDEVITLVNSYVPLIRSSLAKSVREYRPPTQKEIKAAQETYGRLFDAWAQDQAPRALHTGTVVPGSAAALFTQLINHAPHSVMAVLMYAAMVYNQYSGEATVWSH